MSCPFGYSLHFYKANKLFVIFNSFKCHERVGQKRVKATFVITKVIQNNKIFCVS